MSELLDHCEKQVIFYSKGWFQRNDEMEDLRILTAEHFVIPITSTRNYHVYDWIINIFFKLQKANYITITIDNFMKELFNHITPTVDQACMIHKMMVYIQGVHHPEGLGLGEPDYNLLKKYERSNSEGEKQHEKEM